MGEILSCRNCSQCEGGSQNPLDEFFSDLPIRRISPTDYSDALHDFKRLGYKSIDKDLYHEKIFKPLLYNRNYQEEVSKRFFYSAWESHSKDSKLIEFIASIALLTNVSQTDFVKFSTNSILNSLRGIINDFSPEYKQNQIEDGRFLIAYHYLRDILECYFLFVSHHALEHLSKELTNGDYLEDLYSQAFEPHIIKSYLDRLFSKFIPTILDEKPTKSLSLFLIDLDKFFLYYNKSLWDDSTIRENLLNEFKSLNKKN